MKIIVTGGGGFVMANVLRHWLEADPGNRALCIDAAPLDAAAQRYFGPVRDRLDVLLGDVASAAFWDQLPMDPEGIVHGAAVTPHAYVDAGGISHDPERDDPLRILDVNTIGTVHALNFARRLPRLRRFLYVSTGSVYAEAVAAQQAAPFPLPEDGYLGPRGLYDVSKYASELITRRFHDLYGLATVSVRLSSVFGPLDRRTAVRNVRNVANLVAHAALEGRRLRVADAGVVGDYVYAPDVADAVRRLLAAPADALRHDVYNVASGVTATVRDLADAVATPAAGFSLDEVEAAAAEIGAAPGRRAGRWAAYDVSRAAADVGWRPRPLGAAMSDYVAWLRSEREAAPRR